MKRPYFNELERAIITDDNSFSASRMKLKLAVKNFEKLIAIELDSMLKKIIRIYEKL